MERDKRVRKEEEERERMCEGMDGESGREEKGGAWGEGDRNGKREGRVMGEEEKGRKDGRGR